VGLAEANPNAYVEKGRFSIPDQGKDSWAYPVVAGGKLYIRDQETLTAYDVKAK
jgi:outer membrane protein assembly factor BamB